MITGFRAEPSCCARSPSPCFTSSHQETRVITEISRNLSTKRNRAKMLALVHFSSVFLRLSGFFNFPGACRFLDSQCVLDCGSPLPLSSRIRQKLSHVGTVVRCPTRSSKGPAQPQSSDHFSLVFL